MPPTVTDLRKHAIRLHRGLTVFSEAGPTQGLRSAFRSRNRIQGRLLGPIESLLPQIAQFSLQRVGGFTQTLTDSFGATAQIRFYLVAIGAN